MSAAVPVATPAPAPAEVPVVDSFAVAAQLRMTTAGTTARLMVGLPAEVTVTPAVLVPALLSLGRQVLDDYRLTGHELPAVEVTAVERVQTVPAAARATGFTVGVTNDLTARRSTVVVDSDLLLGTDEGVALIAATLSAGAEHLMETTDRSTHRSAPSKRRSHRRRNSRRRR
ncbi:hypothetical protein GCM10011374_34230 [Kocuria dechangensis]|uniref:Uncharacterized protein n=1 Tax=Kocuria dechangensis TaxID=1176249 RepID=A0A917M034_9MICC|nr:hypothetical protein [Kocuria dechangensis]GGG67170.1 hypothetical protein GCM10011374_34230 [Kocuria dechangensis]